MLQSYEYINLRIISLKDLHIPIYINVHSSMLVIFIFEHPRLWKVISNNTSKKPIEDGPDSAVNLTTERSKMFLDGCHGFTYVCTCIKWFVMM